MIGSPRNRRSLRLPEYDYGFTGTYFVTICTKGRISIFGVIVHGSVMLNEYGEIVAACWADLPHHYPNVLVDCFIVMPNHLHGLIEITDKRPVNSVGAQHAAPEAYSPRTVRPGSLAAIVRSVKAASTRRINLLSKTPSRTIWQRNYYEHVVREESELEHVREYIVNNPSRWADDEENPDMLERERQKLRG